MGYKRGTRRTFKKDFRSKMKITPFIEEFKEGEKVIIDQNPFSQSSMPHYRFKGKIGVVSEKRGKSYVIEVNDGDKPKTVVTRPEHLRHAG